MRSMERVWRIFGAAAAVALIGCGGAKVPVAESESAAAVSPAAPGEETPAAKAGSAEVACPAGADKIRGWIGIADPSQALAVDDAIRKGAGAVAVRAAGCALEVVSGCRAPGRYAFQGTPAATTSDLIYNRQDLFRFLPTSGRELASTLGERGLWSLENVTVGAFLLDLKDLGRERLEGSCDAATHFVRAARIGALRILAKGPAEAGREPVVRKSASFERCLLGATDTAGDACREVVAVELAPLRRGPSLPPSDPHPLLDAPPGPDVGQRLEADHLGERQPLPVPGRINVLVFWTASCLPCADDCPTDCARRDRSCAACEKARAECLRCEDPPLAGAGQVLRGLSAAGIVPDNRTAVVAVATGLDTVYARSKLAELGAAVPMVVDDERAKLARRYQIGARLPAVFVIDPEGNVRFHAADPATAAERAARAVTALVAETAAP